MDIDDPKMNDPVEFGEVPLGKRWKAKQLDSPFDDPQYLDWKDAVFTKEEK